MENGSEIRLCVAADLRAKEEIILDKDQAHYVTTVMRRRAGDTVLLFNGRDGEWRAEISEAGRKSCALHLTDQTRPQVEEPGPWLLFAPVKRTQTDLIVEKATELGASRLLPIFSERTNAGRVNLERLSAIATEAAEQCRRLTVPEVKEPAALRDVLADWPADRRLFLLDETGGGTAPSQVIAPDQPGALLIGPEGGFTLSELDFLRNLSFVSSISLGRRVLRAETAALAALACWQTLAGDWR